MDISSITPTVHRTFQQLGHGTVAQRAAGLVHKVVPNGLGCHLDPNFKRINDEYPMDSGLAGLPIFRQHQ